MASLEREVSIAHDTIADLKDEITSLRSTTSKHASLATELEALQASYTALDARHKEQRGKSTSLQVVNAELKAKLERLGQSNQQFDGVKHGLVESNEQLKQELSTLKVGRGYRMALLVKIVCPCQLLLSAHIPNPHISPLVPFPTGRAGGGCPSQGDPSSEMERGDARPDRVATGPG